MNSTNKSSRTLMAMLWIAYAAIYVGRKNFSVCMAGMIADGIIDKVVGGAAGTAFLAVYACGQLIHGIIGNRVSPKLMISVGLFGAGVANVLMGMAVTGSTVPRIWALCGFFASMLWSSVVRCISEWMPEDRQASAGVYISVTLPVGSIVSYVVCSVMMRYFGWRQAFFACAFILFAAGVVFLCGFTAIRHYIKEARAVNRIRRQALSESKKDGSADVRAGGKSYGIVGMFLATGLICVIGGILFNGILKDGLDLWVPTYMTEYFGISVPAASLLTGILPIVNLAGVLTARRINDRFFRNEVATAAVMFGISLISFVPLLLITLFSEGSGSVFLSVAAVLLLSVTSSSMLGVNIMLLTFAPFHFSAIGYSSGITGFLNFCSYAAASLSGIAIGSISSQFGWPATIISFAVCSALGMAVCAAGIRPWKKGSAWLAGENKSRLNTSENA